MIPYFSTLSLHPLIAFILHIKLFTPSEIIFANDEHVLIRILVTNLHVLCFDIYAIPTYEHLI